MLDTPLLIRQMPAFKKAYKKLHAMERTLVNKAIMDIVHDPTRGEHKKGDLAGVYVYKFTLPSQHMLLAYEWSPLEIILLLLDVEENFYRTLKR